MTKKNTPPPQKCGVNLYLVTHTHTHTHFMPKCMLQKHFFFSSESQYLVLKKNEAINSPIMKHHLLSTFVKVTNSHSPTRNEVHLCMD